MEISEDFAEVCREGGAGFGRGRNFFADDPGLKFGQSSAVGANRA
jgi:hypothetical protein